MAKKSKVFQGPTDKQYDNWAISKLSSSGKNFQGAHDHEFPKIALSTKLIEEWSPMDIYKYFDCALKVGYRQFNIGCVSFNSIGIGRTLMDLLPKYKLNRSDVYIAAEIEFSKYRNIRLIVEENLHQLKMNYIDLYIISCSNWRSLPRKKSSCEAVFQLIGEAFLHLFGQRKIFAFGMAMHNYYGFPYISIMHKVRRGNIPMVVQIDWNPFHDCAYLTAKAFCTTKQIILQTCCTMGEGPSERKRLLSHTVINSIAEALHVTPGQVLIRWVLQQNVGVLIATTRWDHLVENINAEFTLTAEQVSKIRVCGKLKEK